MISIPSHMPGAYWKTCRVQGFWRGAPAMGSCKFLSCLVVVVCFSFPDVVDSGKLRISMGNVLGPTQIFLSGYSVGIYARCRRDVGTSWARGDRAILPAANGYGADLSPTHPLTILVWND
ncbi:hypothetical protein LY78DRAFT_354076 [Colletotrichum sublineola]|nr:hypothetical protein LY78DRAFT_354076 [Colletotrichum sublineola]